MTSFEIEDVLSSIRRLVSEEVPAKMTDEPDGKETLLLTPSQRIAGRDPEAPLRLGEDEAVEAPEASADVVDAGDDSLEASIDELEAAMRARAERWSVADAPKPPAAAPDAGAAGNPAAEPADAESPSDAAPAAEPSLEAVDPDADAAAAADADGPGYDDWEPADDVPPPVFLRDGVAPSRNGETVDGRAQEAPHTANVAAPDVDSLLDEAELRALVAEVLREELKGALGERITRNVRKLVRREIAQALSSLDLD